MLTPAPGRYLSGVLRPVPAQTPDEAVTAVKLRFAMSEAMHPPVQSLNSRVTPVATNVALDGDLSRDLE
jgi:hypothetical protein